MELLFSRLAGSALEILLFGFIPLVWWLVTARGTSPFLPWLGLKPVGRETRTAALLWSAVTTGGFFLLSVYMLRLVQGVETAASDFSGLGAQALPAILVYAFLNTALPEELLFRGFLLKRLSGRMGFTVGNTIQAVLFGALHGVLFLPCTGTAEVLLIFLFTGCIAWLMGYINEKKAGGSILPSWMIHAAANVFSGICSAFLLIGG